MSMWPTQYALAAVLYALVSGGSEWTAESTDASIPVNGAGLSTSELVTVQPVRLDGSRSFLPKVHLCGPSDLKGVPIAAVRAGAEDYTYEVVRGMLLGLHINDMSWAFQISDLRSVAAQWRGWTSRVAAISIRGVSGFGDEWTAELAKSFPQLRSLSLDLSIAPGHPSSGLTDSWYRALLSVRDLQELTILGFPVAPSEGGSAVMEAGLVELVRQLPLHSLSVVAAAPHCDYQRMAAIAGDTEIRRIDLGGLEWSSQDGLKAFIDAAIGRVTPLEQLTLRLVRIDALAVAELVRLPARTKIVLAGCRVGASEINRLANRFDDLHLIGLIR